jgi:hypothetical protein
MQVSNENPIMKLKLIPILIAAVGMANAAPEGLRTGIPTFLDTDGDGVISEAERQAFVASRKGAPRGGAAAWDTNGDGVVDAAPICLRKSPVMMA